MIKASKTTEKTKPINDPTESYFLKYIVTGI